MIVRFLNSMCGFLFAAILFFCRCSDISIDEGGEESQPAVDLSSAQATKDFLYGVDLWTEGPIGPVEKGFQLKIEQSFLAYALREQNLIDIGDITVDESIHVEDIGLPCIESFFIKDLAIVGLRPDYIDTGLDRQAGLVAIELSFPHDDPLKIRGLIEWENSCSLADLGDMVGDQLDLGGVVGGILDTVVPGTGEVAEGLIPPNADLFGTIFGVDLTQPNIAQMNIFDENQFDQLDDIFGVDQGSLDTLEKNLAGMSLDQFLRQDLFQGTTAFEVDLVDFRLAVPLIPGVKPSGERALLTFDLERERFDFSFQPRINKFGVLPKEVLNLILDLIFPKELIDEMVDNFKGPAAEMISLFLDVALEEQVNYLSGDFSQPEFDPLFSTMAELDRDLLKSEPIERETIGYRFDFEQAVVDDRGFVVALNGLISNGTVGACLSEFSGNYAAEAAVIGTTGSAQFAESELGAILSEDLINQALYAFVKAGILCRRIDLDEDGVVIVGEELLAMLVEDVPKIGRMFPKEVRQATLKAFLEQAGLLELVRNKPISITIIPVIAPRVNLVEGKLGLRGFRFQIRLFFGETEMLRIVPEFAADLTLILDGERNLLLSIDNVSVGGEVAIFTAYTQGMGAIPIEELGRKLLKDDYDDFLNRTINAVIEKQLGKGIPIKNIDLFGLSLGLERLLIEDSSLILGFTGE